MWMNRNLWALKFVHYFSIHRFLIFKTTCNVLISPIYSSFCNNHFKLFIFFFQVQTLPPVRQPSVMFADLKGHLNLIFLSPIFSAAHFSWSKYFCYFLLVIRRDFFNPKTAWQKRWPNIFVDSLLHLCLHNLHESAHSIALVYVKESSVLWNLAALFWYDKFIAITF